MPYDKGQLDSYSKIVTKEVVGRNAYLTGSINLGGNLTVSGSISGSSIEGIYSGIAVSGSSLLTNAVYLTGSTPNIVASQSGQVIQFALSQNPNVTSVTASNFSGSSMSLTGSLYVDGNISGSFLWDTVTATHVTGSQIVSGSSIYGKDSKLTNISGSEVSISGNLYVNGDISGSMITDNITALNVTGSSSISGSNIYGATANITNVTSTNITGSSSISGSSVYGKDAKLTNISGSQISVSGNLYVDGDISGSFVYDTIVATNITGSVLISGSDFRGPTATITNLNSTNITGSTVSGSNIYAPSALITNVTSTNVTGSTLVSGSTIAGATGNITNINSTNITGSVLSGSNIYGPSANITSVTSTNVVATNITGSTLVSGSTLSGATTTFQGVDVNFSVPKSGSWFSGGLPQSFIFWSGSDTGGPYFAKSNTTGKICASGSVFDTVMSSVLALTSNGDSIYFKIGNYGDVGSIAIPNQGMSIIGEGKGNDTSPYGGVVLNFAASGGIDISNASNERWFFTLKNITLNGGNNTGVQGIHSDSQASNNKCLAIIEDCYFVNFKGAGSSSISLTNHETCFIRRNVFSDGCPATGSVIWLKCNDYYGGNVRIEDNEFYSNQSGNHMITILTSDGKENDSYWIKQNHVFSRTYPAYFICLNASSGGGSIKQVKLLHNRMENMLFILPSGSANIQEVEISGNQIDGGYTGSDHYYINMSTQTRWWDIHDNYFNLTGSRVCIYDVSNQTAFPSIIHNNIFYNAGTYYSGSGTPTKIYNNVGWVTEGSGLVTLSAESGSFAHGLSSGPTKVFLTPSGSASDMYMGALGWYPSGSAGIWIVQTGSGTVPVNWRVEA